jgi:8-oxo-dGTP diphosphatase
MLPLTQKQSQSLQTLSEIEWENWTPVDVATLLFVVQDGMILLIRKKRGLGQGKINGPGGRLEEGETIEEAAVREVEEELCITPLNPQYKGESLFQFTDGYSLHVHIFMSNEYRGEPAETEEAIPIWVSVDKIPYEEMWADDYLWVPLMMKGIPFSGRYIFRGDQMVDFEITCLED